MTVDYTFGSYTSLCLIEEALPSLSQLGVSGGAARVLLVCDENTERFARTIAGSSAASLVVLSPGEESKTWPSVEKIIAGALAAGLGRDGLFVGVGGGVVTDLTAFAASVYMRGASLSLVPTTLLAMADAALGGKTGFDLYDLKNLVGTFRPADTVFMPTDVLRTLPKREWLSGFAEVVKSAIIGDEDLFQLLEARVEAFSAGPTNESTAQALPELVSRCAAVKGRIVEADPTETGSERALLNLGHTFGHALESCAGLGVLTHGEAVAWGMSRACALGSELGITPALRAERITRLLDRCGYCVSARHPAAPSLEALIAAMRNDKKKKSGEIRFIVPGVSGATMVKLDDPTVLERVLGGID